MAMDEENCRRGDDCSMDVLVEILRHLPPNSRRRSRLVCREWRDTVNERTPTDLRSRAVTLVVSKRAAYVLDNKWAVKQLMVSLKVNGRVMEVVGTCNGLICLCDKSKPGGAISLANPSIGERLVLPPLPCACSFMRGRSRWHTAYGFGHHQGAGQYKVVRIPCCFDGDFRTVQVFTLGDTCWRDVSTPAVGSSGARCLRDAGIVSVDGAAYWVADGTERIMSFDLAEERITSVKPLPVPLPRGGAGDSFHLAEVSGRLGVAIINHGWTKLDQEKTDVWVLESARGKQRWSRWYSVEMSVRPQQLLTLPHFEHGNHVLTRGGTGILYRHELKLLNGTRERPDMVQISKINEETEAATGHIYQAFAYVETKEPLHIYKLW